MSIGVIPEYKANNYKGLASESLHNSCALETESPVPGDAFARRTLTKVSEKLRICTNSVGQTVSKDTQNRPHQLSHCRQSMLDPQSFLLWSLQGV